jgi:hypothetical protein
LSDGTTRGVNTTQSRVCASVRGQPGLLRGRSMNAAGVLRPVEHRALAAAVRKAVEERVTASADKDEDDEDSKHQRVSHDVLSSPPRAHFRRHGSLPRQALVRHTSRVVERSVHIHGRHENDPPDGRGRDDREDRDEGAAVSRRQRPHTPHGHAGAHREEREYADQCQRDDREPGVCHQSGECRGRSSCE